MVDINEGCDKEKPASSLHREHRFELTEAIIMMYTKPSLTKLIDGFVSQMLQGAIPRTGELVDLLARCYRAQYHDLVSWWLIFKAMRAHLDRCNKILCKQINCNQ